MSHNFPVFTDGQQITYVGAHHDTVTNALVGKEGTIYMPPPRVDTAEREIIDIMIEGQKYNVFKDNITPRASKDAIDAALKLLRSTGEVTYVPRRAPFAPRTVHLNDEYSAVITGKDVRVGCQRFDFDKVEDVYNAVQAARAYNREPHGD